MDSSATLHQLKEKLIAIDMRRASQLVSVLIIIYLILLAAELTWKLLPAPSLVNTPSVSLSPATTAKKSSDGFSTSAIQQLNLFGELGKVEAQPVVEQQEVKVTKLNLKLTGVVATEDPKQGAAIIENRGKQRTYGINDKVEGTRAILREIYPDRVILEQAGTKEALMLEGRDYSALPSSSNSRQSVSQREKKERRRASRDVMDARKNISKNPGKITDYIRISPVRKAGKIQGYRLMPGRYPDVFRESGLRPNDLATELNGYDLTNPANAMTAIKELRSATQISVTVMRNEEPLSIEFSIPEGN